jgi:hypothetical protein
MLTKASKDIKKNEKHLGKVQRKGVERPKLFFTDPWLIFTNSPYRVGR